MIEEPTTRSTSVQPRAEHGTRQSLALRLRLFARMYGLVAPCVYLCGSMIGLLFYYLPSPANRHLRSRMTAALGEQHGRSDLERILRIYWQSRVYEKLDMIGLGLALTIGASNKVFDVRGREHLDAALEQGNGALFTAVHHSSNVCCALGLGLTYPHKVSAVAQFTPARTTGVRRAFRQWIWDHTFEPVFSDRIFLPTDAMAALKAAEALWDNGIVLIAGDVSWRQARGIRVRLMGEEIELPLGGIVLSEQTNAPVFLMRTERRPNRWQHIITIVGPISLPMEKDRPDRLRYLTALLEEEIRQRPGEWMQW